MSSTVLRALARRVPALRQASLDQRALARRHLTSGSYAARNLPARRGHRGRPAPRRAPQRTPRTPAMAQLQPPARRGPAISWDVAQRPSARGSASRPVPPGGPGNRLSTGWLSVAPTPAPRTCLGLVAVEPVLAGFEAADERVPAAAAWATHAAPGRCRSSRCARLRASPQMDPHPPASSHSVQPVPLGGTEGSIPVISLIMLS